MFSQFELLFSPINTSRFLNEPRSPGEFFNHRELSQPNLFTHLTTKNLNHLLSNTLPNLSFKLRNIFETNSGLNFTVTPATF